MGQGRPPIPEEELIEDIERVSEEVDGTLTAIEYDSRGEYSSSTVRKKIGWNRAKREAGLETYKRRGGR